MDIREFAEKYIDLFKKAAALAADQNGIAIDIWVQEQEAYLDPDKIIHPQDHDDSPVFSSGPGEGEWDAGDEKEAEDSGLQSIAITKRMPEVRKELDDFLLIDLMGKLIPAMERALPKGREEQDAQDNKRYDRTEVDVYKDPKQPNTYRAQRRTVNIGHYEVLVEDSGFIKQGARKTMESLLDVLNAREDNYNKYLHYMAIHHIVDRTGAVRKLTSDIDAKVKEVRSTVEMLLDSQKKLVREVIPNIRSPMRRG